jgi:hypothetical protein
MTTKDEAPSSLLGAPLPASPPPTDSKRSPLVTKAAERYATLKLRQGRVTAALSGLQGLSSIVEDSSAFIGKLDSCGAWLALREYLVTGKVAVSSANFCDVRGLCLLCDRARARALLRRYVPRIWQGHNRQVDHYMMTLTWPPPAGTVRSTAAGAASSSPMCLGLERASLRESIAAGAEGLRKLWNRAKKKHQGPFRNALGIVASLEIAHSGEYWHPHFHCVVTMRHQTIIEVTELRREWEKLTGGRQLRLDRMKDESDLVEVLKYSIKPASDSEASAGFPLTWRVIARQTLLKARLIRSYGVYQGMGDVEDLSIGAEPEDYLDWIFSWTGSDYRFAYRTGTHGSC